MPASCALAWARDRTDRNAFRRLLLGIDVLLRVGQAAAGIGQILCGAGYGRHEDDKQRVAHAAYHASKKGEGSEAPGSISGHYWADCCLRASCARAAVKAVGISVPQEVLLRADEVIQ